MAKKKKVVGVVGIFSLILLLAGYGVKFGFGLGEGDGNNNNAATHVNTQLQNLQKYTFYFDNDKIHYKGTKISVAELKEKLKQAKKEKEEVKFTFKEKTTTYGFQNNMEQLAKSFDIAPNIEVIKYNPKQQSHEAD